VTDGVAVSISTASLYHLPLHTVFRLAAEAGFDGVEVVPGPEIWLGGLGRVAALSREYHLPALTVHQTLAPLVGGSPARRLREAVGAAIALGARHVVIHPPEAADHREPVGWLRALDGARPRAAAHGVRLALENSGYPPEQAGRHYLGEIDELVAFAERRDLDVTLDTCHVAIRGLSLLPAYEALRPRLANIHLSNLSPHDPPLSFPYARPLLTEHRVPEDGVLDLAAFLRRLRADGYGGPLTYEISPLALRFWSPTRLRRRLEGLVAFVRAHWPPASAPRHTG
jgi:sugar phosphate isomerase/epimerase